MIFLIAVFRGGSLKYQRARSQASYLEAKLRSKTSLDILGKLDAGSKRLVWGVVQTGVGDPKVWHIGPVHCHTPARRENAIAEALMLPATIR